MGQTTADRLRATRWPKATAPGDELQTCLEERDVVARLRASLELVSKERELSRLQQEISSQVETKLSGQQRTFLLNEQLKTIKTEFGLKIKMLLDKAENDDKLVLMLKQEIARLENVKGAKSQLRGAAAIPATQDKDIGQLKNQVRCLEIELEQKNAKLAALGKAGVERQLEEKDFAIADLSQKCEHLEREIFELKA